jgi:hypothetical protein
VITVAVFIIFGWDTTVSSFNSHIIGLERS